MGLSRQFGLVPTTAAKCSVPVESSLYAMTVLPWNSAIAGAELLRTPKTDEVQRKDARPTEVTVVFGVAPE
jgi:hypothetical protein